MRTKERHSLSVSLSSRLSPLPPVANLLHKSTGGTERGGFFHLFPLYLCSEDFSLSDTKNYILLNIQRRVSTSREHIPRGAVAQAVPPTRRKTDRRVCQGVEASEVTE